VIGLAHSKLQRDTDVAVFQKFIIMVRLLHDEMTVSVLVNGQQSEYFKVQIGVKQSWVIASTLFSIYLFAV